MTKEEKKAVIGVRLSLLLEAKQSGYDDINDYIDALKEQIIKLQTTNRIITKELQEANMKLDNEQQEAPAPDTSTSGVAPDAKNEA